MSVTSEYILNLSKLKSGDLGLLRTHSCQGIDESAEAFDLFAGIWWPLRQKNQFAPRRKVAWLIAKLYAFCPIENSSDKNDTFARQLRRCEPYDKEERKRFRNKFDELLTQQFEHLEFIMQWALKILESNDCKLNWAQLTDDLSRWEQGEYHKSGQDIREIWAIEYLYQFNKSTEKEK